jgi:hypothetical protein
LGQNPHKPKIKPTRISKTIGDTPNGIGRKDYDPGSSAARRETPEEMASSMQRGGKLLASEVTLPLAGTRR